MLLTPAEIKPKSFESKRPLFILPGVDASRVYVRARALGCFHSLISTETFRRALTASLDSCAEILKECPFSGVTKSGRVWRKVPESDARSVRAVLTSRWPALECPVLMMMMWGFMYPRIARDIRTLTNRAQLSHATNLPILTGNRRVGGGGRGREGSSPDTHSAYM